MQEPPKQDNPFFRQLQLASQSPRRREMLAWLGVPIHAVQSDVDETPRHAESPRALAIRLARDKARSIAAAPAGEWLLAADTVVEIQGVALGKPSDAASARAMLRRLRARSHQVHTGVILRDPATGREATRCVTTRVWMRPYNAAEIAAYVASGDPFDKAGGYAIQHPGFHPVERLDRCYANVVGLPLCAVLALLNAWGLNLKLDLPAVCHRHFGYRCPALDDGKRSGDFSRSGLV